METSRHPYEGELSWNPPRIGYSMRGGLDMKRDKRESKRELLIILEQGGWNIRSFERLNISALIQIIRIAPKYTPKT
jgi:hypothetical protein